MAIAIKDRLRKGFEEQCMASPNALLQQDKKLSVVEPAGSLMMVIGDLK